KQKRRERCPGMDHGHSWRHGRKILSLLDALSICIHVAGGGGWAGGNQTSLTVLTGAGGFAGTTPAPSIIATVEGAVSANTDTGHTIGNGSFAMNPDGSINTVLWNDFAQRGVHEMAVKSKEITKAYYGKPAKSS